MASITLDRHEVIDALLDAGLDEEALRDDYSGRGMYGATCFGIVGNIGDFARFIVSFIANHADDSTDPDWLGNVLTDGMGLDTIFYWPGVQVNGDE